ncbi:DUF5131 family protein [Cronbergia sp. UHCC 0137]|uniref:DUF5131 family protein n=1 Tax=Cronbergia sp. UHCC 0137 TaxID=3110239 RepID=UPI002B1F801F|nr:DUF5131 family protein [Cronbergia sp. UHCC 0137]MEA5619941.1 DUF5131 family protein [Cronbergia sp. UHCC 0137]
MSKDSNIEWTGHTWPIVTGCDFAGEGCPNCYALKDSWRLSHNPNSKISEPYKDTVIKAANGKLQWSGVVKVHIDRLNWVLKWKKPAKIFVCNMADLFHEKVPDDFIDLAFAYMAIAQRHTFQILTKRPERMQSYMRNCKQRIRRAAVDLGRELKLPYETYEPYETCEFEWPLPNGWLGVSVENQKAADTRIPILVETPAKVKFLSCEPLLEELDLSEFLNIDYYVSAMETPCGTGIKYYNAIDWIIAGGESGPNARVCHVEHLRSLVQDCQSAEIPIFIKQLGTKPMLNNQPYKISDSEALRRNRKGGILTEFPEDLQLREFPTN